MIRSLVVSQRAILLFGLLLLGGCSLVPSYQPIGDPLHHPGLQAGINSLQYIDGQLSYVYVPQAVLEDPSGSRILVAIHGYKGRLNSRSGRRVVRQGSLRWAELAEQNGWVILSPQFDARRFDNDYQRLNLRGQVRADLRLHQLVNLIGDLLPGLRTDRLMLFGFSGGAQFVHRYAMLHPSRVDRAVAVAAGWYTFPDPELPYPLGIRAGSLPTDLAFDANGFASVQLLLMVGEHDASQGAFKRSITHEHQRYNLLGLQGTTRVERAQNWVNVVKKLETANDLDLRFVILPATAHTVNRAVRERTRQFLSQ